MSAAKTSLTGLEVAIIGMAGRFPGARDLEQFWSNLRDGVESIRPYDDATLLDAGVRPETLADPTYVKVGADLDDAECFDADLFGYSPREAEIIDPQHRIFLEGCWAALEDAAYDPEQTRGAIGVFASATLNNYLLAIYQSWMAQGAARDLQPQLGNDKDYLATRVAYKLGLRGPSLAVQTACSSSLVAVHLASQALLAGDCRLALAGGVSVQVPRKAGYFHQPGGIFSPDGACRAFDAQGAGTVFGSGMGVVALARLDDALESGDRILAVIKGSAVNNDGSDKVGFTAPGSDGQMRVIRAAQRLAEVDPDTLGYVEAHGTGTPLGDPIEVEALTRAFRKSTDRRGFCALGSVKTNVGHLGNAAGMAGLMKSVLALEHSEIPPSLHFEQPNPHIDFEGSPFVVADTLRPWPRTNGPRRAGVSSFGVGGTNGHVVLEEAPSGSPGGPSRPHQLLLLSAHSEAALDRLTTSLANALDDGLDTETDLPLADAAYSLAVGRRRLRVRRAVTVADRAEAVRRLRGEGSAPLPRRFEERRQRGVVFLFPGQGAQRVGSGAELYRLEPTFRATVDRCLEGLRPHLDEDLRPLLLGEGDRTALASRLAETRLTQPALFVLEVALASLLEEWGQVPEALLGHSLGEISAAHLAGIVSLDDALRWVVERGRLIQGLPKGSMLSVHLEADALAPRLGSDLSLAVVNGPGLSVVSGPTTAIDALARELVAEGIEHRRLQTSHAFHSAMMDPILEPYRQLVAGLALAPPKRRLVSNVTGTWLRDDQATDPGYWVDHLRQPVRFGDALATLVDDPGRVFLEVGPGQALSSLVRRQRTADGEVPACVTTLVAKGDRVETGEQARLLDALGELWCHGATVDWQGFHRHQERRRVGLPTYPFEPRRFWIGPASPDALSLPAAGAKPLPAERWYHLPCWKPTGPPVASQAIAGAVWIIGDGDGVGSALLEEAGRRDVPALRITAKGTVPDGVPGVQPLDLESSEAWKTLLAEQLAAGKAPTALIHLAALDAGTGAESALAALLAFARAAATVSEVAIERLLVVTRGAQAVTPREPLEPAQALLPALALVLPRELEGLSAAAVDLASPPDGEPSSTDASTLASRLWAETAALDVSPSDGQGTELLAWRDGRRYRRDLETVTLPEAEGSPLPRHAVVLITGGLGGLGLAVARHLATNLQARLVLASRSGLPEGAERDAWLSDHGWGNATWRRLHAVAELEALGAEVWTPSLDVTDTAAVERLLTAIEDRWGQLDGVVHAAGLPGGGLAALEAPEATARVLAPKVQGTRALAEALGTRPLSVFALFASTLGLTGGLGQVSYAAANAFLDSFAHQRAQTHGGRTVAIDWPGWSEVGMAATALSGSLEHPLLERRQVLAEGLVYTAELAPERHWVLAEHRGSGVPILPGTVYLELVRAAFANAAGEGPIELREVVFQAPLTVPDGAERTVQVLLVGEEPTRFAVQSLGPDGPEVHALGRVQRLTETTAPVTAMVSGPDSGPATGSETQTLVLEELVQRVAQGGRVTWGEHWHCRGTLEVADRQLDATVELAPAYQGEIDTWGLHPSLLDVATATGLALAGEGDHLPFTYDTVQVFGSLPAQLRVHVERRHQDAEGLTLDVSIADADDPSTPRVVIRGYTLRRVVAEIAADVAPEAAAATDRADAAPKTPARTVRPRLPAEFRPLAEGLDRASGEDLDRRLTTAEGLDALDRILAHGPGPQVAVSKVPVAALDAHGMTAASATPAPQGSRYARPELSVPYEAPGNPLEEACVEIWQDVLALDQVGIHDNFFELGGHSLMAIQLTARLSDVLEMEVTVATLFEHPTIAELIGAMSHQLVEGLEGADLDEALAELEGLSEDEVAALLAADEGEDHG